METNKRRFCEKFKVPVKLPSRFFVKKVSYLEMNLPFSLPYYAAYKPCTEDKCARAFKWTKCISINRIPFYSLLLKMLAKLTILYHKRIRIACKNPEISHMGVARNRIFMLLPFPVYVFYRISCHKKRLCMYYSLAKIIQWLSWPFKLSKYDCHAVRFLGRVACMHGYKSWRPFAVLRGDMNMQVPPTVGVQPMMSYFNISLLPK